MNWNPPKPSFLTDEPKTVFNRYVSEKDVRDWYEKEILPLFENAREIHGTILSDDNMRFGLNPKQGDTHTAIIVNLKQNKEDTAEGLLREHLDLVSQGADLGPWMARTQNFFESRNRWELLKKS